MADTPEVQHSPNAPPGMKGFFQKDLAGMPTWVWLLVIGAGITAAILIPKFLGKSTGTPTTGATPDSGLGLAVDPTSGLPYAVEGLVPSGGTTGGTTGGSTVGPPGPIGPPGPPGTPGKNLSVQIRQRFSQPGVMSYDQKFEQGVPIRKSPTDLTVIGYAPYGSNVQISGTNTGGTNLPGPGGTGSNVWYQLTGGGYVSQFDIGNIGHGGKPSANGYYPPWPGNTTQVRIT